MDLTSIARQKSQRSTELDDTCDACLLNVTLLISSSDRHLAPRHGTAVDMEQILAIISASPRQWQKARLASLSAFGLLEHDHLVIRLFCPAIPDLQICPLGLKNRIQIASVLQDQTLVELTGDSSVVPLQRNQKMSTISLLHIEHVAGSCTGVLLEKD